MIETISKTKQLKNQAQSAKAKSSTKTHSNELLESPHAGFTMTSVANLSQTDIRQMNSQELIAVIQTADIPLFREKMFAHLPYYDKKTLEQLAFLAQRTVQNLGY